MIELRQVTFAYSEDTVVNIDGLTLPRGSIAALTGPNGCGKTTLLKLLNGLVGPYSGTLLFDGLDIDTPRGLQEMRYRSIYVHQNPYAFRQSVLDNVLYALAVRKVASDERNERAAEALEAVRLSPMMSRQAHTLSGGEKQRLALARALALKPDLLLLDEPTSNIDPDSVRLIENAVVAAGRSGTTVLLSTHNLATAYRIATLVLPMAGGGVTPDLNNVYHGSVAEGTGSLAYFEIGGYRGNGGRIRVPAQEGSFSAAVVPMSDVILSEAEVATSAQNHFSGAIREVTPLGSLYRIRLECPFPLDALVTGAAVIQLDIRPGKVLFASFKASAVRLY